MHLFHGAEKYSHKLSDIGKNRMKQKHHNQTKIDVRLRRQLGYYGNDPDDDHGNDELEDKRIGEVFVEL